MERGGGHDGAERYRFPYMCREQERDGVGNKGRFGVATIIRPLTIICLFCRMQSLVQGSFAKETYNCKESTNRSHAIPVGFTCAHVMCQSYSLDLFLFSSRAVIDVKIVGLFCRIASLLQVSFDVEITYS